MFRRLRMRSSAILLVLLGAMLVGGCIHPAGNRPPPPSAEISSPSAPHRLLHVYADSALPAETTERNRALAETIALTLRDQLRQRGFDVRGAESAIRDGTGPAASVEVVAQLGVLARNITVGNPAPATSRVATYLHPNSPRLLLFVALTPIGTNRSQRTPELGLGGFLADSATGEILWSGRTSARTADDNQSLRLLADKLVRNLAALPTR
jgi:hypothetical protein